MPFNPQVLTTVNLLVQILLLVTVLVAARVAKKKQLIKHCKIVRWAVAIQLLAIFLIMLPSTLGYSPSPLPAALRTEILAHHSLGVLSILLWIYVNLVVGGKVKVLGNLRYT